MHEVSSSDLEEFIVSSCTQDDDRFVLVNHFHTELSLKKKKKRMGDKANSHNVSLFDATSLGYPESAQANDLHVGLTCC